LAEIIPVSKIIFAGENTKSSPPAMTLSGHPHTFRCTTNQGALDEELTTLVGFSAMPHIFVGFRQ